jgi:ADP-heptose:LPS heptosyltransferase
MPKYQYHLDFISKHLADRPLQWEKAQRMEPLLQPPSRLRDRELETAWQEAAQSSRRVIIHPGSGSPLKNWPLERFILLAENLRNKGCSVLWWAGPAEEGMDVPVSFAHVRNRSIADLIYLLGHCDLYVGNDSGISHCAAATNTACVLIYGPSDPIVWRPSAEGVRILSKRPECGPCHLSPNDRFYADMPGEAGCGRRCLTAITVDEVYHACAEALKLYKGDPLR